MASSSSSGVMASSSSGTAVCIYDVFLSFRGEDTRHSFTDHLYHRLKRAGIHTFRDDEKLNRGEELKPEFERAIKASKASIVVLSENYATSTWCLDELMLILKQRRECNHFVLPVFYRVEPTDVRNQIGSFAIEVKPSSRWTYENVFMWKRALMEVANLSGFTLSGHETSILKKIVDTMYNKLGPKDVHLPLNITGMLTRYGEINSWLYHPNLEFLEIYGMGGSGKTTFAKYIYDSNQKSFEYVSFIENIGSRSKETNGLLKLQEQLIKDILGGKKRKISGLSQGTCMIEDTLQMKRVLIVLDDIVQQSQLDTLLGNGKINSQSKIIITTRERFDLSCWRCQEYEMKLLNADESLELLCRHAFRSKIPMAGFEEVVLQATQYCEGNPLALEVLGSSMSNNTTVNYWRSQLNLLEKDIHYGIQSVLIRSYMALPYNTQKELFLHIACFFIGKDVDYVVQILEPDYSAISGIQTLISRCLLSVSPNKKLMMHRLLQEMGKNIVRQESTRFPAERSRVWHSNDSYKILSKENGSEKIEGLALDMKMLSEELFALKSSYLKTGAFRKMVNLKLLQLNFVELKGSHKHVSEDLRWLCWHGFHLRIIPVDLCMGNLVAVDMSYSNLEVFEPPTDIQSLKILNLKDSHKLSKIQNITRIPNLETLILWNCYSLVNVCENLGDLSNLALLNMTGCRKLYSWGHRNQPTFSFPFSLHRLFLKDCNLECTDSFPLSFSVQPYLQYLNLCNSLFESLPSYNHLENLRVLDLSFCVRLKCLLCLPDTLAELYIYYCESLEKITFQSHRFPLQEFGYEGCHNLHEIEGFFKLQAIVKLDESDLGHMKWLKKYQNYEICLVGDDELTVGRSKLIQMLYEFDIMSTSLPDVTEPIMKPNHTSKSSSLSFDVPSCPKYKRLVGIHVTFKYSISGDDMTWFCKVNTTNGVVDLMYNPKVFGKPEFGEVCTWVSYWPIGYTLKVGDIVNVSIVVISGLEVHECGVSLVYSDFFKMMENNMGWTETLGGDLSGFQLSTGAYYLCRRDFFELMEVGRLNPNWFRILVGDTIDYNEVRGWRKTGRPKQVNPSFIELKTIRCIIHGPQWDDIYNIADMVKSSIGDKTIAFTSSLLEGEMKSGFRSELKDEKMVETMPLPLSQEIYDKQEIKSGDETDDDNISTFDDITFEESDPYSHEQKEGEGTSKAFGYDEINSNSPSNEQEIKKIVFAVNLSSRIKRHRMMKELSRLLGIKLIDYDKKERKLTVTGDVDYVALGACVRKIAHTDLLSVEPASERLEKHVKPGYKSGKEDKFGYEADGSINNSAIGEGENMSSSTSAHRCRLFSLKEIKSATKSFNGERVLGKGRCGTMYKGQISSKGVGHSVAIKRFGSMHNHGELEFRDEIDMLCKFHHRHLVSLIGYCYDITQKILVYEYMPNGSLFHHLHEAHTPLSWVIRLKIAIGAAHGLVYLHTSVDTRHGVIHRNVKSANILLDDNWEAVISDLGLSIIGPTDQSEHVTANVTGTLGYLDPEYASYGKVTYKSDVYSFGVVLFELISGRRAIDRRYGQDEPNLVTWAQKCVKERKLNKMVGSNIQGTVSTKCLRGFAQIVDRCVNSVSEERPTMSEVLTSLQALLEIQENFNLSAESSDVIGQSGTSSQQV